MAAHIPRFHVADTLQTDIAVTLADTQAHHLRTVLRAKPGDEVKLFNEGAEFLGEILAIDKRSCEVKLTTSLAMVPESALTTVLGLAVLKRDAMRIAIEKAVELGITRIVPVLTDRVSVSQRQLPGQQKHWRAQVLSATEQCGRCHVPEVADPVSLDEMLKQERNGLCLIAHPDASPLDVSGDSPQKVTLLVGPEGGFADDEVTRAESSGYERVSIGPRILRAETAPLAMLAILQQAWGN